MRFTNATVDLAFDPQRGTETCRHCGSISAYTSTIDWVDGQPHVTVHGFDDRPGCPHRTRATCPLLTQQVAAHW